MRPLLLALALFWPTAVTAKDLNVEFKFTPYLGNPATVDTVETVPGKAKVYINNALINEITITQEKLPVLFEEREISPSLWLPVESLGRRLRKGKNTFRVEFSPKDSQKPYQARLSWATVTDEVTTTDSDSGGSSTNQSREGRDNRQITGKVVFEREFNADFAQEYPWHTYPPITDLSLEDKQSLTKLVTDRAALFRPSFGGIYQLLQDVPNIKLAEVKKSKCLEKAYRGGMRVTAQPVTALEFTASGTPEILISAKGGELYTLTRPKKLSNDDLMCAGIVFSVTYPNSLAVVRTPTGEWQVVY